MLDDNIKPSLVRVLHDTHEKILDTGLTEDMIITIIHDSTKIDKNTVRVVINALMKIERKIVRNAGKRKKMKEN